MSRRRVGGLRRGRFRREWQRRTGWRRRHLGWRGQRRGRRCRFGRRSRGRCVGPRLGGDDWRRHLPRRCIAPRVRAGNGHGQQSGHAQHRPQNDDQAQWASGSPPRDGSRATQRRRLRPVRRSRFERRGWPWPRRVGCGLWFGLELNAAGRVCVNSVWRAGKMGWGESQCFVPLRRACERLVGHLIRNRQRRGRLDPGDVRHVHRLAGCDRWSRGL
ncbi:MAG: hypothetical protein D6709_11505 [Chloroflexi bacterium]|uniref:Uncharacterized protein n=1 Tax=Candidatus Thermofonsia Clade 3 bacterium TaxID=2364212 RepID=A0A2M8QF09_9CHLR|nr:MAG: hypothetical protein CUN48_03915 [Candidatus Thermofonsia Clade 3 bacterium]RMG62538.1 MAG: hypothetical protein D6709_11505 [Chloroflexota bacterium]